MPRRTIAFAIFALAAATLFVRLGIWQLHRLGERRRRNDEIRQQFARPAVDVRDLPNEPARARYRRTRISGSPDYDHELVLTLRTHDGSPGVELVTPIRRAGSDTAVLVNRGWVYAPDGVTVDEARWHESAGDTLLSGYADVIPAGAAPSLVRDNPRLLRTLDRGAVARAIPCPVSSLLIVATDSAPAAPGTRQQAADRIARLQPPALDEGPHLSYAIQWFSFAIIALVGTGFVIARDTTRESESMPERRDKASNSPV